MWTREFGTVGFDGLADVAVDAHGGVYVAGNTEGTLPGQTSVGGYDPFIRKYDATGNEVWTRQFGTPSPAGVGEAISGLAVDANGEHVYAVGTTSPTVPGEGAVSIPFIRKYDAAGNEVWTRQPETSITFSSGADGVALDNAGDIYVAGTVSRRDPSFGDPIFIQKYDPAGQVLWSREFGGEM